MLGRISPRALLRGIAYSIRDCSMPPARLGLSLRHHSCWARGRAAPPGAIIADVTGLVVESGRGMAILRSRRAGLGIGRLLGRSRLRCTMREGSGPLRARSAPRSYE